MERILAHALIQFGAKIICHHHLYVVYIFVPFSFTMENKLPFKKKQCCKKITCIILSLFLEILDEIEFPKTRYKYISKLLLWICFLEFFHDQQLYEDGPMCCHKLKAPKITDYTLLHSTFLEKKSSIQVSL